jgi:co-chaperonin GroES (HSP10)
VSDPAQGFKPIAQWILIEPRDAFESGGTIALPQSYDDDAHGSDGDFIRERNKLCLGIVRGVGCGRTEEGDRRIPDVEVGELVMYDRASAKKIEGTSPLLVMCWEDGVFFAVEGAKAVFGGLVTA